MAESEISYSPYVETPDWKLFTQARSRQQVTGLFTAVVLVLTLCILIDGLLSEMRGGGSYRLEMLTGTSMQISGPVTGSFSPTEEDMEYFPIPSDAPVSFSFDAFFASYWFGTSMWRGQVVVPETAAPGTYAIAIGVKGTPSSQHQTYTICVAPTREELDAQSLSLFRRTFGMNPFWVAAALGALGLTCALGAFVLGYRCDTILRALGLAEVFKVRTDGEFLRVYTVTGKRDVASDRSYVAYDANLRRLGKVIYDFTDHGVTESLFVRGQSPAPAKGSFVAFWDRQEPTRRPDKPSIFGRKAAAAPEQKPEEPADQPGQQV